MIGFIKKAIGMSGLFQPKRANELIDDEQILQQWNQ